MSYSVIDGLVCTISYKFAVGASKSLRPTCTGSVPVAVAKKLQKLVATNMVAHRLIGKSEGRQTCYSAPYTSHTRVQQRFTISEVAAD